MKKRHVLPLLTLSLLASCSTNQSSDSLENIEKQLSLLDGVTSFNKVEISEENKEKNYYENAYTLTFNTPIDWNDPSLGYFNQRVFLGYKGKDKVNTYLVGGYGLYDAWYSNYFQICPGNELSNRYDGNFIAIEYRFFYKSKPEGFSTQGTKYLEYLNSEEASHDFHNIISKLQSVLTGKSIFTGASKGGLATEAMAYYYPKEVNSYVSYVAPLCDGLNDLRLYDYLYTKIGNDGLGVEEASRKRELLLSLSRYALNKEDRSLYLGWLNEAISKPNVSWTGRASLDELWECAVSEAALGTWQYNSDFNKVETIINMKEDSPEEKQAKEKAVYDYVIGSENFIDNINQQYDSIFPYYFQTYSEMGNYCYCFDYLEEAGCYITTSKEEQKDLFIRVALTKEQQDYLQYSPALRNSLIDFMNTTDLDIVKIVGYNDPWYSVRAPETDNKHIHLFKENNCHRSTINGLDEESKETCWSIVDGLLK